MRFGQFGLTEILILLLIILLIFGAKRLPEVAKGLGSSIRQFKKALLDNEDSKELP